IVAGDENAGVAVGRLVEHEVRVLGTIFVETHFGEKPGAEAGALDRLEIILRNDHVGVDIDDRHGRGDARQLGKLVHESWSVVCAAILSAASQYTSRPGKAKLSWFLSLERRAGASAPLAFGAQAPAAGRP